MKRTSIVFCLLVVLGSIVLTPANSLAARPEVRIWKKVQLLLNRGQVQAACQLAEKLWKYKDTPTYDKAEIALEKRGISLGDPLGSFTLMRIIDLQNHLEDKRAQTGRIPSPGPRKNFEDGWFKPIRVEIITRKGFAYMLRSAGRDGKWMSNDDFVIGVRSKAARAVRTEMPTLNKGARSAGRSSLYGKKASKPKPSALPGADLDELIDSSPQGSSYSGASGAKKTKPTGSGEKAVTLDDLLNQ